MFGTLHTTTAATTVDRIIDQFPADRQEQIRVMLSESLKGVISQTLCKKIGGGRVAAREILLSTPSVTNLIREGKTFQIPSVMQTSKRYGMVTLNDALIAHVDAGDVEPKEAWMKAVDKPSIVQMLKTRGLDVSFAESEPHAKPEPVAGKRLVASRPWKVDADLETTEGAGDADWADDADKDPGCRKRKDGLSFVRSAVFFC